MASGDSFLPDTGAPIKAEPLFSPYCIGITLFVLICGGCFVPIHIFILNSEAEGKKLFESKNYKNAQLKLQLRRALQT